VTIAVTTPAGHAGPHVARMLGQAGVRPRLLLRDPDHLDPGLRDVAVGGIVGMARRQCEGFVPEQPRSVLMTTPSSLAGRAVTHLRPAPWPRPGLTVTGTPDAMNRRIRF
jgi:hypothetical protein